MRTDNRQAEQPQETLPPTAAISIHDPDLADPA